MPSTVYKGDLAEVSFGHETGIMLIDGYANDQDTFSFTHTTLTAADNTSLITFTGGSANTPVDSGVLEMPEGMLIGCKLSVRGTDNFTADDSTTTGKIFTIIANSNNTITITPALKTAQGTASTGGGGVNLTDGDALIIHGFGCPTFDVGMSYNATSTSSSESVLTDQFLGLTSALTLPETKVDLKRYHVVGLGRDIAVQAPGRFTNEGGSFEVNMHNPRWLYYCLGMEAVDIGTTYDSTCAETDYTLEFDTSAGAAHIIVKEGTGTNAPAFASGSSTAVTVGDYVVIKDANLIDVVSYKEGDGNTFSDATCDYNNDPTITMDSTALLKVGMRVSGTGIPAGATIASITNTTTFELSASTTGGSVTNGTLTFTSVFGSLANPELDYFDQTEKGEMRRIAGIKHHSSRTYIWLDDALCFSHAAATVVRFVRFREDSTLGSPDRASSGALTNGVTRLLYSRSTVPSFAMEVSIRRTDVDGSDLDVVDGGTSDSKQLTRVFRGCKVKDFNLTTDTDAALRLTVNYDAAFCYTDTGRLEGTPGDRYNPHRMFEDTANTKPKRKESGVAVGTQKPYMFYNGQITLGGVNVAQVVSFNLSGSTGVTQYYTINGTKTNDAATDQVPFTGSRNPSLSVEGKTEYSLDMEIIVDDPLFYHKMRRAVGYDASVTAGDQLRLSFTKSGTAANRETLDIIIDDYVITEAPLQIPEDKGPIRSPMKILPKGIKVISTDTLFHC